MHLLGALVRSQSAECCFFPSESKKKKVATSNGNPTGSLFFGSLPPGMLKKEKIEQEAQPGDMGRGMRTGSHTPWAQGPANLDVWVKPGYGYDNIEGNQGSHRQGM